jgi:hypothetical protein
VRVTRARGRGGARWGRGCGETESGQREGDAESVGSGRATWGQDREHERASVVLLIKINLSALTDDQLWNGLLRVTSFKYLRC